MIPATNCVHHDQAVESHGLCHSCYELYLYTFNRARKLAQYKAWAARNADHLKAYYRAYRERNKDRINAVKANYLRNREVGAKRGPVLRRLYGIEYSDYAALEEAQRGVCAICGHCSPDGKSLGVDHNHETGAVRGLLCSRCNIGLGQFLDSAVNLGLAIDYLNNPPAGAILKREPNSPITEAD